MGLFKHGIKGQPATIIDLKILYETHGRFRDIFSRGPSQGFVEEFPLMLAEIVEI